MRNQFVPPLHPGEPSTPNAKSLPSIVTLEEASRELRCSKAHLSHIVNGKVADLPPLPVVRIGRRVLIRRDALVHWLWTLEAGNGIMPEDLNSSLAAHGKD